MAKHTAGPWKLIEDGEGCREIVADNEIGLPVICDTVGLSDDEEDEANARLITAAPDLLKALEQCLSVIGPCAPGSPAGQAKRSAKVAIKKAAVTA